MMQLMLLILKKTECIDELLKALAQNGIKGGTIVDANGMGEALLDMEELPVFGTLRKFMSTENKHMAKILMIAIKDNQVVHASNVIKSVVGDLSKPNTGIIITLPIYYCEGLVESDAA